MDQKYAWGTDGDKFSILFLFHANTVVFAVEKKYPINRTDVVYMSETGLSRRFCNTLRREWSIIGFSRTHKIGNIRTSGIHGGYRLLFTYDLRDSKPRVGGSGGGYSRINFGHLKFEFFHFGGVFRSKLWSSQIWSFSLGGYSGVNWSSQIWTFSLGGQGVFWSKLWSSQIWCFSLGGYSGVNFGHLKSEVFHGGGYSRVNFGHLKSEVFHWGGGAFWSKLWSSQIWSFSLGGGGAFWSEIPERGFLENFDKKFTVQPETCLCITDSLSHTTFVETN